MARVACRFACNHELPTVKSQTMYRLCIWMGGRVVDCARLESVCSLTGTQGSNPCPSAIFADNQRP